MLGKRIFEGVNGLAVTDEPCPITYFPEDITTEVRRLTRTKDEEAVFFVDYVLRDETVYVLYFEVAPKYRNTDWLQYLNFDKQMFDKGYAQFGKFTKSVWVNTTESVNPTLDSLLEKRIQLSKNGFVDPGEVFIQGSTMKYVDARGNNPDKPA